MNITPICRTVLAVAAAGLLACPAPARTQAGERVVTGDGVIAATLNGNPVRIRIDPNAPGMPILRGAAARAAGLKPSMVRIGYRVGPVRIGGYSANARLGLGGAVRKQRVGWVDPAYASGLDGVAGPGGLPEAVVRFVLRAPVPGERITTLPMVNEGGLFGSWSPSFARVPIGTTQLTVRFDPYYPRTLATAGAAIQIAAANDGRMIGEATPLEIVFGVERPVRTMRLARPFVVGPFTLRELAVRTADFGNASGIRDSDPDPDEVVVTGKGRKVPEGRLSIGADLLAGCSSITFDKPRREIRLSCR